MGTTPELSYLFWAQNLLLPVFDTQRKGQLSGQKYVYQNMFLFLFLSRENRPAPGESLNFMEACSQNPICIGLFLSPFFLVLSFFF